MNHNLSPRLLASFSIEYECACCLSLTTFAIKAIREGRPFLVRFFLLPCLVCFPCFSSLFCQSTLVKPVPTAFLFSSVSSQQVFPLYFIEGTVLSSCDHGSIHGRSANVRQSTIYLTKAYRGRLHEHKTGCYISWAVSVTLSFLSQHESVHHPYWATNNAEITSDKTKRKRPTRLRCTGNELP